MAPYNMIKEPQDNNKRKRGSIIKENKAKLLKIYHIYHANIKQKIQDDK